MLSHLHPIQRWNAIALARYQHSTAPTSKQLSQIHFGYIAPINYLDYVPESSTFHLCLAHLLKNKAYCDFYKSKRQRGDLIFMDNSAFELGAGIESDELLDLIDQSGINPQVIVAPDYPGQHYKKTLDSFAKFADKCDARYSNDLKGIMGVPQGEVGKHQQWLECYKQLASMRADVIGMSILALPNAFCSLTGTKDISHNRIFGSLYLKSQGLFEGRVWHHYLGAGSPSEMQILPYLGMADSMDSSSPIWHGINLISYDDSPTGLINGKIQKHVNFDEPQSSWQVTRTAITKTIEHNINYVARATLLPAA